MKLEVRRIDYDQDEVDETVLALLCLTIFSEGGVTIVGYQANSSLAA